MDLKFRVQEWGAELKTNWFGALHHIYVFAAVVGTIVSIFTTSETVRETFVMVVLVVYMIILLIVLGFMTYTLGSKARYAEATKFMHQAQHKARNAYHYLEWCYADRQYHKLDLDKFAGQMGDVLSSACMAFTMVTGAACRMSIKTLGHDPALDEALMPGFFVKTLARDGGSAEQCKVADAREGHLHRVAANTDFRLILEGKKDYYFKGDLTKAQEYENSKRAAGNGQHWDLPYRSTIVWPIRYVMTPTELDMRNQRAKAAGEVRNLAPDAAIPALDQEIYGYLTVDCNARNVFSERYDVQFGAALADSLFAVFSQLRRVKTA